MILKFTILSGLIIGCVSSIPKREPTKKTIYSHLKEVLESTDDGWGLERRTLELLRNPLDESSDALAKRLLKMSHLNLDFYNITSLDFVQYLPNLRYLSLLNHRLSLRQVESLAHNSQLQSVVIRQDGVPTVIRDNRFHSGGLLPYEMFMLYGNGMQQYSISFHKEVQRFKGLNFLVTQPVRIKLIASGVEAFGKLSWVDKSEEKSFSFRSVIKDRRLIQFSVNGEEESAQFVPLVDFWLSGYWDLNPSKSFFMRFEEWVVPKKEIDGYQFSLALCFYLAMKATERVLKNIE